MEKFSNILVVGAGYVGMSIALMLSKNNKVKLLEKDIKKVNAINKRESYLDDEKIEEFLKDESISIKALIQKNIAFKGADLFIICLPTDFNQDADCFDTSLIEEMLEEIFLFTNPKLIVIKSTIPIGFIDKMQEKFQCNRIIFSPEFLREGSALSDSFNPSRIVIGGICSEAKMFTNLLVEASKSENIPILYVTPREAEAIKLFSNTYLAMRVAFFNELDSLSIDLNFSPKAVIDGLSFDTRIGNYYNNPSFGYGGYCLPKDSRQLLSHFSSTPQSLISSIVKSNRIRKEFLTNQILEKNLKKIGVYRLEMKKNSDNFRSSSIIDIISLLEKNGKEILIYEPKIKNQKWGRWAVEKNITTFKNTCDLIISNRVDESLADVSDKVFTRDIYHVN